MTEKLTVKYIANNDFAKEPVQASEDAVGYDLYAAEAKPLFPHSYSGLTIELRILRDHFINCDSGVVNADYRSAVVALLINHSSEHYTIRDGNRIVQMVFMKQFDVKLEKVPEPDLLGKTNRDMGGFGSTEKEIFVIND